MDEPSGKLERTLATEGPLKEGGAERHADKALDADGARMFLRRYSASVLPP